MLWGDRTKGRLWNKRALATRTVGWDTRKGGLETRIRRRGQ
jgi:hypothetical protein